MSTVSYLASLVQQAIGRMNAYEANAKKVDELPHQTTLEPSSKIPVSRAGISEHLTVQQIISSIQNSNYNQLLAIGTISVSGTDITVPSGVSGQINGLLYGTSTDTILSIALCPTGFSRKDIIVLTTANTVVVISGEETNGAIVLAPPVPTDALYITEFDVNDTTIGAPIDPSLGTSFKKKSESAAYNDPTLSGTDAVISLQPNGQSVYAFSNAGLTSIDGFGLDLITGNPSAETPYPYKDILIYNNKATDLILKHDGSGTADVKFLLEGGVDLVIPAGGKVWLKYGPSYCEMIFKSWSEVDLSAKLDKSTTPSSVYTTDAGGLQVMKSLIDFKDVLEFADFDAFPTTGETSKIYLALDTNFTYRWSGSVYVQIGGINQDLYPIKYRYQATGAGIIQTIGTNAMLFNGTQSDKGDDANNLSYRKIVSAATAGSSIFARESSYARVAPNKGYQFLLRFRIADSSTISDVRGFHGLQVVSGFGNTDISANTQPMCGIGCNGTDTNIHIFSRQSTFGTLVKIDTGFSKTLNHEYLLTQERLPNSNAVVFTLKNLTTSTEFTSTVVNNSSNLTIVNHRNNNASTLSCGFEIQRQELNLSE